MASREVTSWHRPRGSGTFAGFVPAKRGHMASALAAHRAAEVLRYLASHPDESPTLSELSEALGVGLAAMHGVLDALVSSGFIERTGSGRSYRLGTQAVVLGSAARAQQDRLEAATHAAVELADRHRVRASIVRHTGDELVVLDGSGPRLAALAPHERAKAVPGTRIPFSPPWGSVFVAEAPPQDVLAWMSSGSVDAAGPSGARLRGSLAVVAARGWAVSRPTDEMTGYLVDDDPGVPFVPRTISAVVRSGPARSDLALVLVGFDRELDWSEIVGLGEDLVAAAGGASEATGTDRSERTAS